LIDPAARRRRRLLLAALVVVCLVLITAGFGATGGGASGGPLGALGEGASKVFKPVRDLVRWVGDTADAKGENQDLRAEAASLRKANADLRSDLRKYPNQQQLRKMVDDLKLQRNAPVPANVIGHSPTAWATTVTIDRGANDGIEVRQAVVGADGEGAGLVGFVSAVRGSQATVSLLPSQDVAVGARLDNGAPIRTSRSILTLHGAGAGTVADLELDFVPSTTTIPIGAMVKTSGTAPDATKFPSNAPPDLPIGRVTRVDNARTDEQVAHVRPLVDLQTLEDVQVLTRVVNRNRTS
jgi:rod shape-determining protein MreC